MGLFISLGSWLKRRLREVDDTIFWGIFGTLIINLSLIVHEASHFIAARIIGCTAFITELNFFTGSTGVGECTAQGLQIIALAGPVGTWIFALYLYFREGKNSLFRMLAIMAMAFSVLPSTALIIPQSDFSQAVTFGFSLGKAALLSIIIFGYTMFLFAKEMLDEKFKPVNVFGKEDD